MKPNLRLRWLLPVLFLLLPCACSDSTDDTNPPDGDGETDVSVPDGDDEMTPDGDKDSDDASDGDSDGGETPDGDSDWDRAEFEPDPPAFLITHFHPDTQPAGEALDYTFAAENGTPPYTNWTITKGNPPPGTSLNAETGQWSGTPTEEGLFFFVVTVSDGAGEHASELFGIRIGDPGADGPLFAKAQGFQQVYEERHFRNNFTYDIVEPHENNGYDVTTLTTLGDATFAAGQCTMAMSFRASALEDEESKSMVRNHVDGWRFFERLTGVPGLLGRSFVHKDDAVDLSDLNAGILWPDSEIRRGEGELSDWYWRSDTSRDQISGAVLGLAAAYDFVDDDHVREEAGAYLVNLAHHVWDNDMRIVDPDGEMTKYGDINGEKWLEGSLDFPNGQSALIILAWLKIAHHISGERKFKDAYEYLVYERDYLSILRDHQWVYSGYGTKYYNTYISYENFYHLMRLEEDPWLRREYVALFRDTLWLNTDDITPNRKGVLEHNPVKTAWYLYSTGQRDAEALYHALSQIAVFPEAPLRDRQVMNSEDPSITINPDKTDESLHALPSDRLPPDMVMWHRSTFKLDGGVENGRERSGCDYLLPYWMARHYGYVSEQW